MHPVSRRTLRLPDHLNRRIDALVADEGEHASVVLRRIVERGVDALDNGHAADCVTLIRELERRVERVLARQTEMVFESLARIETILELLSDDGSETPERHAWQDRLERETRFALERARDRARLVFERETGR
jgi:predicted DNA-binding protein